MLCSCIKKAKKSSAAAAVNRWALASAPMALPANDANTSHATTKRSASATRTSNGSVHMDDRSECGARSTVSISSAVNAITKRHVRDEMPSIGRISLAIVQ